MAGPVQRTQPLGPRSYGQGCPQRSAPREVCLFFGKAEISAMGREKGQRHVRRLLVLPHLIFTGTQCANTALSFMRGQIGSERGAAHHILFSTNQWRS